MSDTIPHRVSTHRLRITVYPELSPDCHLGHSQVGLPFWGAWGFSSNLTKDSLNHEGSCPSNRWIHWWTYDRIISNEWKLGAFLEEMGPWRWILVPGPFCFFSLFPEGHQVSNFPLPRPSPVLHKFKPMATMNQNKSFLHSGLFSFFWLRTLTSENRLAVRISSQIANYPQNKFIYMGCIDIDTDRQILPMNWSCGTLSGAFGFGVPELHFFYLFWTPWQPFKSDLPTMSQELFCVFHLLCLISDVCSRYLF